MPDNLTSKTLVHRLRASAVAARHQRMTHPDEDFRKALSLLDEVVTESADEIERLQREIDGLHRLDSKYFGTQRAAVEPSDALPHWTCPNCEVRDEFSVRHDTVDIDDKRGGYPVTLVIECHACKQAVRPELRGDESRIDLPLSHRAPEPPSVRRETIYVSDWMLTHLRGHNIKQTDEHPHEVVLEFPLGAVTKPAHCDDCGVTSPTAPDHPAHGKPCPVDGCAHETPAPLRGQYFRDSEGRLTCKHGTILYGRSCITCERDAVSESAQ